MGFRPPDTPDEIPDEVLVGSLWEWVEGGRFNVHGLARRFGRDELSVVVLACCDGVRINSLVCVPVEVFYRVFTRC